MNRFFSIVNKLHLTVQVVGLSLSCFLLLKAGWDFKQYQKNHQLTEKDSIEWWDGGQWYSLPDGEWRDLAIPPTLSIGEKSAGFAIAPWEASALEFMKKNQLTAPELHDQPTINSQDNSNIPKYSAKSGKLIWKYPNLYAEKIKADLVYIQLSSGFCLLWWLLKLWCQWLVRI